MVWGLGFRLCRDNGKENGTTILREYTLEELNVKGLDCRVKIGTVFGFTWTLGVLPVLGFCLIFR